MIQCPKCGHQNSDDAHTCADCQVNLAFALAHPDQLSQPPQAAPTLASLAAQQPKRKSSPLVPILLALIAVACLVFVAVSLSQNTGSTPAQPARQAVPQQPAQMTVVYEVVGTASGASLTWYNEQGGTEQGDYQIPFRKVLTFRPGQFATLSAQNLGESGSVTCRISVNGKTWKESTSEGAYKIASCSGIIGR